MATESTEKHGKILKFSRKHAPCAVEITGILAATRSAPRNLFFRILTARMHTRKKSTFKSMPTAAKSV
jgi:hypothetical protein